MPFIPERAFLVFTFVLISCAKSDESSVMEDTALATGTVAKSRAPAAPSGAYSRSDETSQVPPWYNGSKPWSDIPVEVRRNMLAMRAAYEAQEATARQPGTGTEDQDVADGRRLIDRIVQEYQLDPVYKEPETFGERMVIWLPIAAWNKLSSSQRRSLEAYMSSQHANWGIGVGRVRGRDVLYDKVVVQH